MSDIISTVLAARESGSSPGSWVRSPGSRPGGSRAARTKSGGLNPGGQWKLQETVGRGHSSAGAPQASHITEHFVSWMVGGGERERFGSAHVKPATKMLS